MAATKNVDDSRKQFNQEIEKLTISRNEWRGCAKYYAEKFQLAYKGYLMTQGMSEFKAHQESLSVLDKLNICED
jgi:hypothetical protein